MTQDIKKRLTLGLKKYIPIFMYSAEVGTSEKETIHFIKQMLYEMFGYDEKKKLINKDKEVLK